VVNIFHVPGGKGGAQEIAYTLLVYSVAGTHSETPFRYPVKMKYDPFYSSWWPMPPLERLRWDGHT
jgi:hypothetical protein